MTNDQIANMPTRVYLDTRPDRCTTVAGSDLLRKLTVGIAVESFPLGLIVVVVAADHLDIWHSLLAGVAAYVFVAINVGVLNTANLFSDRAARRKLGERYGVPVRLGTASFQRRRIRIEHAPADIASPVASAMHAIDPSVKITRNEREEVEAMRPGTFFGPSKSSRIVARWEREEDGAVVVIVESSPGEMTSVYSPRKDLLYADHGRSLENVEEFQLALRREIETAALAGAGAGEAREAREGEDARQGRKGLEQG